MFWRSHKDPRFWPYGSSDAMYPELTRRGLPLDYFEQLDKLWKQLSEARSAYNKASKMAWPYLDWGASSKPRARRTLDEWEVILTEVDRLHLEWNRVVAEFLALRERLFGRVPSKVRPLPDAVVVESFTSGDAS